MGGGFFLCTGTTLTMSGSRSPFLASAAFRHEYGEQRSIGENPLEFAFGRPRHVGATRWSVKVKRKCFASANGTKPREAPGEPGGSS